MVMTDFEELDQYNFLISELKDMVIKLETLKTSDHHTSSVIVQNIQCYIIAQMDTIMDSMKDIKRRIDQSAGKVA